MGMNMEEYKLALKKKNVEKNEVMVVEQDSAAISTVNVDQALQEWEAYQTITEKMLDDTDYQQIQGRAFKKKSAWRKYARAFNITTEIMDKDIVKTDKGNVIEASFIVRATLPTGRYADGWGNCSRQEGNKAHPNHDIPATAMTRATNRAIADLIGAGEVTAEEIMAEEQMRKKASKRSVGRKAEPDDDDLIIDVEAE